MRFVNEVQLWNTWFIPIVSSLSPNYSTSVMPEQYWNVCCVDLFDAWQFYASQCMNSNQRMHRPQLFLYLIVKLHKNKMTTIDERSRRNSFDGAMDSDTRSTSHLEQLLDRHSCRHKRMSSSSSLYHLRHDSWLPPRQNYFLKRPSLARSMINASAWLDLD